MKKILIADAQDEVRALVTATLAGDERYRLLMARDGAEALELARRERPDLVFLDVGMPGLDGFEVCRRLKGDPSTCGATVILLTAQSEESDRRQGAQAAADGFFPKPFSPTALLDKAYEVLGLA